MNLRYETLIRSPRERVFAWHTNPDAFQRLAPPWRRTLLKRHDGVAEGSRAVMRVSAGPASVKWVARHEDVDAPRAFTDVQIKGPFRQWTHRHLFENGQDADSTVVVDDIDLRPPTKLRLLGRGDKWVKREVDRLFAYRHFITAADCDAHHRLNPKHRKLRIVISGGSGFVGSALAPFLRADGHEVFVLTRSPQRKDPYQIGWDPGQGSIDAVRLEGMDVVIHLAGEHLLGPWTETKRMSIYGSRIHGTTLLSQTLASLDRPPAVFISASSTTYYGNRGADEHLTEDSAAGEKGFLSYVCRDWEHATAAAEEAGIRTVHLRTGPVLNPAGGVLGLALPFFKLGLGARITGSEIWLSWIALNDLVHAVWHIIWTSSLIGPVNLVAPKPVTMDQFTRVMRSVLRRPAPFAIPQRVAGLLGGTSITETALLSQRVQPQKLEETGYRFLLPDLDTALKFQLGKAIPESSTPSEYAAT